MVEFSSDMHVTLIDSMGNDLRIVNAARMSLNTEHTEFTEPADSGLIRSLIRDEHGAPFEKIRFEFNVEVPIFIARQMFKHRFSSFSEASGRYTTYEPKFWIPKEEDVRTQVGKRMSYTYESLTDKDATKNFIDLLMSKSLEAYEIYEMHLAQGIAREVARINLPLNTYTRFMWGIDLRNLVNFLVLRNSPHAQREIQEAASKVELAFKEVCPITYSIWNELGRPRLAGID
jgi:thymidylate synthase (FAD)